MFLLWSLTSCFLLFGYYGTNNWMPSYLESELGMNFKSMTGYMVGTYTAMILGKVLAGIASDRLYPLRLQAELAELLPGCDGLQVLDSDCGHDGFLLDTARVGELIRQTLDLASSARERRR